MDAQNAQIRTASALISIEPTSAQIGQLFARLSPGADYALWSLGRPQATTGRKYVPSWRTSAVESPGWAERRFCYSAGMPSASGWARR